MTLIANLLVLLANLAVLAVTVKLYTEILKDRKFDVREVRSGPSKPGTPGHRTKDDDPGISAVFAESPNHPGRVGYDPSPGTPAR